jgi:hypothetical protein
MTGYAHTSFLANDEQFASIYKSTQNGISLQPCKLNIYVYKWQVELGIKQQKGTFCDDIPVHQIFIN